MRGAEPERSLEVRVAAALALRPNETLLVAASGGPDSTALASLAVVAARTAGAKVVLGHVNHGVRAAAGQDEAVTVAAGGALGVPVHCAHLDGVAADEASLREGRYAALAELARACGAQRVATAHHARDQSETVLLALFRGTGPAGLAGIAVERPLADGVALVRPLLRVAPGELRAHVQRMHLPVALDASNDDPRYRRTAVRRALSALRMEFPHLDEAVARCAELIRDELGPTERNRVRADLHAVLRSLGTGRDVSFERLEAATTALKRGTRARIRLRRDVELVVGTDDPSA